MKEKIKPYIPGILLVLGLGILVTVLIIILQFNTEGKKNVIFDGDDSSTPKEIIFKNNSSLADDEVKELLNTNREKIINFFKDAEHYVLSEIDKNYTSEDDEEFMVLDYEFLENLSLLTTSEFFEELTKDFELIKSDNENNYYKVDKEIFNPYFYKSAIATHNLSKYTIFPENATDKEISSVVRIELCEERDPNICRESHDCYFNLKKENDKWLIDLIETYE